MEAGAATGRAVGGLPAGRGDGDAVGMVHAVEADVEAYRAGHEQVVVGAGYRTEGAVRTPLVTQIFVQAKLIPLRV